MELQIRFCTSADGVRIAYATLGEGPPLVVVAGWAGNLELEWQHPDGHAFLEGLGRGRSLVRFDRRGVGASQREVDDLSLHAQVADLAAVVDQLKLERFDLVAWAEAGALSVAYAAQHAERVSRLMLWSPYSCGEEIASAAAVHSLMELIRNAWGLGRRALADVMFPGGPTHLQLWWSNFLRQSVSPEVAAKYIDFQFSVDVRPYLPQVKAPTLVLHRRGDRHVPIDAARAAAALIPDARLAVLEGNSPMPWVDMKPVLAAIDEFLGEGEEAAAVAEPALGAVHTILFTDVEGSTALTERLGDAKAREVLRAHERIVREALKSHGGSEVKTMGDGFMTSFSSATRALECAIAMQTAFAEHNESAEEPIRMRIGLNAGEPIAEEKDLFGTAVNMAARIAAQAAGGEILVANVVRELAAGKGFLFSDQGEVTLRGFEDPVRLFEVRWKD
jgi:class 3 adenylate cyclase/pimeloyl-ACP methyl ester carboxylesterase